MVICDLERGWYVWPRPRAALCIAPRFDFCDALLQPPRALAVFADIMHI
jgi:hypothetical protein